MSLFMSDDQFEVYREICLGSSYQPVPLALIQSRTGVSERRIKQIVEELRTGHGIPVGSRRWKPNGYYIAQSVADIDESVAPMVSQAKRMLQAAAKLAGKKKIREMLGQGVFR